MTIKLSGVAARLEVNKECAKLPNVPLSGLRGRLAGPLRAPDAGTIRSEGHELPGEVGAGQYVFLGHALRVG